jgi:hypothetical protein
MIGQTYRHRRTPTPITTPRRTILSTLTQTPMRTQPVALKHTQYHSRIPQTHPLRKRMRLARQTVQTIPQHPVQPLPVNHIRTLYRRPQHTTHRHTHHPAPDKGTSLGFAVGRGRPLFALTPSPSPTLWERGVGARGSAPCSAFPLSRLAGEGDKADKGTSVGYKKSAAWGKFHPL